MAGGHRMDGHMGQQLLPKLLVVFFQILERHLGGFEVVYSTTIIWHRGSVFYRLYIFLHVTHLLQHIQSTEISVEQDDKKSLQKNLNLTKSDNLQKINNTKNIQSMSDNFKLSSNINISNYQKQDPKITSPVIYQKNINIDNINNNPVLNSEINFTNIELNEDITNTEVQIIEDNHLGTDMKNLDNDLEHENNDNINNNFNNDDNLENDNDNAYHHVQVIDEDVENFKRRLDIMMKNFRTDTLKDFMAIKRNLLIEQKACIENEKQKCDALLSSKSDLI